MSSATNVPERSDLCYNLHEDRDKVGAGAELPLRQRLRLHTPLNEEEFDGGRKCSQC